MPLPELLSPPGYTPQLLFDVSELALRDVHTGIQRVARALLWEMLKNPPPGYRLHAVRADATGNLLYARQFTTAFLGNDAPDGSDELVRVRPGDIFLSADLYLNFPFASLQALRKEGLRVVFTIHDLFGLTLGTMLPKAYQLAFQDMAFQDWLSGVLSVADAIVCVSYAVADEVSDWLQAHPGARMAPLPIGVFHLGADLDASKPTQGVSAEDETLLARLLDRPSLLMVGTIEPRKGHGSALAAMEKLWDEGSEIALIIVGKEGWRSHDLVRRLRGHPQRNRRLFWLERASDETLQWLYHQSSALLAASFAEGFGLPLIEAAHYGLPIIARDISVFHEVAGEFAFYFPDTDSAALADSLRHWLQLYAGGKAPQSKGMPYLTWAQSTQQLLQVILENDWYTTYLPAEAHCNDRQHSPFQSINESEQAG
jgi:glycosyltransferase involved in cell wall biosynthesis